MVQIFVLTILYVVMIMLPSLPGSLPSQSPLFTSVVMGFILLASLFLGKVMATVSLPLITGYLLGGMLFGPWGLELFSMEHVQRLDFINHLALAFIALSAGAELEWKMIKKRFLRIIAFSLFQLVIVFIGVFLVFFYLFRIGIFSVISSPQTVLYAALFLGVIATANSPSSAIAIINETRAKGPIAQTVLGVSVIKDILVIGLFAFTVSWVHSSLGGMTVVSAGKIVESILSEVFFSMLIGALIGIFVIVYLKTLRKEQLLFILGLAVICSEISSLLHLNELLLCITVGFIVRNFQEDGRGFVEWLERGSMPLFVIFFSLTGASLDINAFRQMWPVAFLYFAVRILLVWASTSGLAFLMRETPKTTKHLWSGFIPQAGVSLGLAVIIGKEYPEWGANLVTMVIATIAINQVVGPILFKFSLLACEEGRKND